MTIGTVKCRDHLGPLDKARRVRATLASPPPRLPASPPPRLLASSPPRLLASPPHRDANAHYGLPTRKWQSVCDEAQLASKNRSLQGDWNYTGA